MDIRKIIKEAFDDYMKGQNYLDIDPDILDRISKIDPEELNKSPKSKSSFIKNLSQMDLAGRDDDFNVDVARMDKENTEAGKIPLSLANDATNYVLDWFVDNNINLQGNMTDEILRYIHNGLYWKNGKIYNFDAITRKISDLVGIPQDDLKIDLGKYISDKRYQIAEGVKLRNKIKEIAKNNSSFFLINEDKNNFIVTLSDEFKRMFSDEVNSVNEIFINEINSKLGNKVKVKKNSNNILIEAEYKGKDIELNKPMRGDVKKYKVFVKNPKTDNIKKVNFGDKNMEIKRDDPERRKSFRARHKCSTAKDKTTPRYWSCKFWSNKSVSKLLNEFIDVDSIDVNQLKKKDELCPKVWDGEKMNPDVRKALLKNALAFIKFLDMEDVKFKDIILTGSLANYNWTENSDLDVHLILDFDQIGDDDEFINDYFRTKKALWGERLPIKVKSHDVEMYVQDMNEPHASTGVYSIFKDKWLTKPFKEMVGLDVNNIVKKAKYLAEMIDEVDEYEDDSEKIDLIDKFMEKLRLFRKSGLEDEGEFSTENIVFKILRHTGYLEKLVNMKKQSMTKELSLENNSMYTSGTMKGNLMQ
jgi:hypothetical protein